MASIGEFGKPAGPVQRTEAEKAELDTMTVAGRVIRLRNPEDIPMFSMMEFARLIAIGIPAKDMTAQSTAYGVFEGSVLEDDFGLLRMAMHDLRDTETVQVVFALFERWSATPLDVLPESSDGPTPVPGMPLESSRPSSRRKRRPKRETPEEAQARMELAILGEAIQGPNGGAASADTSNGSPQN